MGVFLVATPLWGIPAGQAAASGQYEVGAAADGIRVSVLAENFLIFPDLLDVAVPAAQSAVDSLGNSSGFASNPFPGETVISLSPLLRGQTGQPVPDYPLYAASRHPTTPESEVEQPGYSLTAKSAKTSSRSTATADFAQDGATAGRNAADASSKVDPDTGAATATATSDAQAITINDVLRLGRVRSTATVSVGEDGKLSRSSDLSIADTTVAGQRVAITPDGIEVAGEPTALPSSEPITDALEQAGVRIRYLAPVETEHGVVAAGVEVSARQQDPTSGAVATVTYTLGRATASARSIIEAPDEVDLDPIPVDVPTDVTGSAGEPAGIAAVAGAGPETGDLGAASDAGVPAPAPAPEAAPARSANESRPVALPLDIGASGIYLMAVLAGVAIFTCGTLLRLLGVRTRWM